MRYCENRNTHSPFPTGFPFGQLRKIAILP